MTVLKGEGFCWKMTWWQMPDVAMSKSWLTLISARTLSGNEYIAPEDRIWRGGPGRFFAWSLGGVSAALLTCTTDLAPVSVRPTWWYTLHSYSGTAWWYTVTVVQLGGTELQWHSCRTTENYSLIVFYSELEFYSVFVLQCLSAHVVQCKC